MEPRYNERTFSYFTTIGVKKIILYTEDFVRRGSLYRSLYGVLTEVCAFKLKLKLILTLSHSLAYHAVQGSSNGR